MRCTGSRRAPEPLDRRPQTLNPHQTLDPRPSTPNPQPSTLNPQPSTPRPPIPNGGAQDALAGTNSIKAAPKKEEKNEEPKKKEDKKKVEG
jgi:hypothetical protein